MRMFPLLVALPLVAAGCGPTCQSTCNRLYDLSECGIQRPSKSQEDLISECMGYCESALDQPGQQGSYDPYDRHGSTTSVTLENDQQAGAWMDCVAQRACEDIEKGYCAPVW